MYIYIDFCRSPRTLFISFRRPGKNGPFAATAAAVPVERVLFLILPAHTYILLFGDRTTPPLVQSVYFTKLLYATAALVYFVRAKHNVVPSSSKPAKMFVGELLRSFHIFPFYLLRNTYGGCWFHTKYR